MSPLVVGSVDMGAAVRELVDELIRDFPTIFNVGGEPLAVAWVEGQVGLRRNELPDGLRMLEAMLTRDRPHLVHVTGLGEPTELPPTPTEIGAPASALVRPWDIGHLVVASMVGAVYRADHIRGGRVFHDVFPLPDAQIDTAFSNSFGYHSDGATDPSTAPDYFTLQCLRNPQGVPTFASVVSRADFDTDMWGLLTTGAFDIWHEPDDPRTIGPRNVPVIQVDANGNVVRYNFYDNQRMRLNPDVPQAAHAAYRDAVDDFLYVLGCNADEVNLLPGEILLVRNPDVLHGRRPSTQPDVGDDRRWMRRTWIASDPLRVAAVRSAPGRLVRSMHGSGAASD